MENRKLSPSQPKPVHSSQDSELKKKNLLFIITLFKVKATTKTSTTDIDYQIMKRLKRLRYQVFLGKR